MKTVYLSFLFHANMCYDRYTKHEIRDKFPRIYSAAVRKLHEHPQVTAHIDLPGLTLLSLKHHAPWFIEDLRPLVDRGQVIVSGCQYAAGHALCQDEESGILSSKVSMELIRQEFDPGADSFFPQEVAWHPQMPFEMNQIGVNKLLVMPTGWTYPRRVAGLDGSEVTIYPIDWTTVRLDTLEAYYDNHPDGSFIMSGGDMEQLGNLQAWVDEIERLAALGKRIEWTTVDRYEREVGVRETGAAPNPFGQASEDREHNPSFSRWVGDPEDMIWHGHAVDALDALRAAGFAQAAAHVHGLGPIDPPIEQALTTPPDNPWDACFEHVLEYPETEALLNPSGTTVMTRAWHHAIIGINSDASGWFPWQPRTRHRNLCLQTAGLYANEVTRRFADALAPRLRSTAAEQALVLNPTVARTVEVALPTVGPRQAVSEGQPLCGATTLEGGRWQVKAKLDLPAYGYRLLGLHPTDEVTATEWRESNVVERGGESSPRLRAALDDGRLVISAGDRHIEVSLEPFELSDPSGTWPAEEVQPNWHGAAARIRRGVLLDELEVFTEVAWCVWLRVVVSLHDEHIEVAAEVHIDLPRRIGKLGYHPEGLLLRFRGKPGEAVYDIPHGVIAHKHAESAFAAAQRFAAIDGVEPFGVVSLCGDQSYRVCAAEGFVSLNLGASTQGRPDTRPQCVFHEDGHAAHLITSGGDPFMGSYYHRCAVVFGGRTDVALASRRLRIPAPVFPVQAGGGELPEAGSLLQIGPDTAHVTAFRVGDEGAEIVVNDISGEGGEVSCQGQTAALSSYGVHAFRV